MANPRKVTIKRRSESGDIETFSVNAAGLQTELNRCFWFLGTRCPFPNAFFEETVPRLEGHHASIGLRHFHLPPCPKRPSSLRHPPNVSPNRELVDYFYLLLERSWIIAICAIGAWFYARHEVSKIPETYRATATVEVGQDIGAAADALGQDYAIRRYQQAMGQINTVVEKLKLDSLFMEVAQLPAFRDMLPDPASVSPGEYESALRGLAKEMNAWTKAEWRVRTNLIDLSVVHGEAEVARNVLEGMLQSFSGTGFLATRGTIDRQYRVPHQRIAGPS